MDPRLLSAYNDELGHLRQLAREFGEENEASAAYLGLKAQNDDPYVERLLEGVAFLAARVNLKLDEQFPEFTQHLLQAVQPNYLASTPSMCVVGLEPNDGDDALIAGVKVPRHSEITAEISETGQAVRYRTGHDVTLYPLKLAAAEYLTSRTAVASYAAAAGVKADAGLKLTFTAAGALKAIAPERLPIYLDGSGAVPGELYRQILGDVVAVVGQVAGASTCMSLPQPEAMGFDDDESLLPHSGRCFRGYRILAEYFACPERFFFVGLRGLDRLFATVDGDRCEVVILFRRKAAMLEGAVTEDNFRLYATPAVNLFELQVDRIKVTPEDHEFLVMPDRARPLDYEVFRLLSVTAHDRSGRDDPVAPLYAFGAQLYDEREALYYVTRICPSRLSTREQRRRRRTDHIGSESWISLTAPARPERLEDIRELAVRALVTNRDLPELLRVGRDAGTFKLETIPVKKVAVLHAPTRPRPPLGLGKAGWRAIAQLIPNFSSLVEGTENGASVLRDHLALYGHAGDAALKQVDGVLSVTAGLVTRRLIASERNAFARGHAVRIKLDDHCYENGRMYLFAAVIDRFISEFVSVNSFAETVFESSDQGNFATWPPRVGTRPTI